jgi:hypothetical protein
VKNRIAAIFVATVLTVGIASPAVAAPPPSDPGTSIPTPPLPPLAYYIDPVVALPTCKQISRVNALRYSTSTVTSIGDTSNWATRTGYGTELTATQAIIEDGGYSCTFNVGTKNQLIISVTAMSGYDRSVVETQYMRQYGSAPMYIGGRNAMVGGRGARWQEVSFLLEEGVWVSGKVLSTGDFFPAVLQDVSDLVYYLNH